MTTRTYSVLEDDLDGTEASKTVEFAFDGKRYEIDLNDKHVEQFEKALAKYVDAARRVGRATVRPGGRQSGGGLDPEQRRAIRDWGQANGYAVGDKGRIPAEVVEAFQQAH